MVWHDLAYRLRGADAQLAEDLDHEQGVYRAALYVDGILESCVYIARCGAALDRVVLPVPDVAEKAATLQSAKPVFASEPVVCACFGVSAHDIGIAIETGRVRSIADVGRVLRAGSNCGSCLPELKRILARGRRSA